MRSPLRGAATLGVVCLVVCPTVAGAQIYEAVGTRAQGMAGAFVAIADDATATWWNPAGIAWGALLGFSVEQTLTQAPAEALAPTGPAWRSGATTVALTVPSLGLSYYRLRISDIAPGPVPTGPATGDRQDEGVAGVHLRSLVLNEFGATFGQSLGANLVVASTLRLIHGGLDTAAVPWSGGVIPGSSGAVAGADESNDAWLDLADNIDPDGEYRGDLDLGFLARAGGLRVGLSVKHVNEPDFGEGEQHFELKRQARVGAAWMGGQWAVSADADLTKTPTALGEVRHVAGGAEAWLWSRRLGVRGGLSANTVGDVKTAASAGISLAPRSRMYLDGAMTFGTDQTLEGWSAAFRLTF